MVGNCQQWEQPWCPCGISHTSSCGRSQISSIPGNILHACNSVKMSLIFISLVHPILRWTSCLLGTKHGTDGSQDHFVQCVEELWDETSAWPKCQVQSGSDHACKGGHKSDTPPSCIRCEAVLPVNCTCICVDLHAHLRRTCGVLPNKFVYCRKANFNDLSDGRRKTGLDDKEILFP